MQRALLRYKDPGNYKLVYDALDKAGRMDLVGTAWNCLIGRKKWYGNYSGFCELARLQAWKC